MIFGKHINKYYLKYSILLLLGVFFLATVDVWQLKIPEIYSTLVDWLDPTTESTWDKQKLLDLCLEMLKIVGVMIVGRFMWRIFIFGAAIRVETDVRQEMFDHCKDLSQSYYQVNKVGNLMSLFTNDVDTINECFGDGVLRFCDALILGGMAFYKMCKVSLNMALLALIPLTILGFCSTLVKKYMKEKWRIRQEAFSNLSDYAQESFSGISVIKAFVKEAKELMAFKKISKETVDANVSFVKASALLNRFINLFVESTMCLFFGVGGYLAYKGTFTAKDLILFTSYFYSTVWPVMALSGLVELSSRGKASLKRISDLLDAPIDVKDKDDVRLDVTSLEGKIEFRNLDFYYPGHARKILDNVSFTINKGENIGIVGKTGSGKTTIVDLLLRVHNVNDNTLFIDDMDVNKLPIKLVRKYIAYVPQDNFLFSDTIANNISFAFEDGVKDEAIKNAAILADLDSNIQDFEDGYNTMLGERGVTISGGQKQRTSIARALLKDSSILILDDSVSAVDVKTEKTILENLKKTRKGKTTILIAHRVSTIESMDKIMYIEEGKVIAFDTHENLLKNCKEYNHLVTLQKLEDECEGGNA